MKGSILSILLMTMSISFDMLARNTAAAAAAQQAVPPPPAIFVIGDGFLDVGNNNDLTGGEIGDPPRANHPPYGCDFPGARPTGRFSNGYNMADFIAQALGFPMSPPAYRSLPSPSPTKMEGFTGVNYASADAGIRASTNGNMTIPVDVQVMNFAETRAQLKALLGGRKPLNQFLSKSLFLLGAGTMDLLPQCNFYLQPNGDNTAEVQRLMEFYGASLTKLHGLGARKFGIINVGLLGCAPFARERSDGCDDSLNKLAGEFNAALETLLSDLGTKLHHFRYTLADLYGFTNATVANPSASGFSNVESACCPGPCAPGAPMFGGACDNTMGYFFWDEGYISEQAAKLASAAFYNGKAFAKPVNIRQLIAIKG
ncbi:hypothetical protein U9M48_035223 [Paspalum notatum var. saurae]|uniref:GDSL esterase/lipase n=1 Tax=Paspalum notatum var. saurae TaxID=547442 RepID=A0AAQ3UAP9_PASNO